MDAHKQEKTQEDVVLRTSTCFALSLRTRQVHHVQFAHLAWEQVSPQKKRVEIPR